MKYLKFLKQQEIHPLGDYSQMTFTFQINDAPKVKDKYDDTKTIDVRLTGREDASLRAHSNNYKLEPALFTIAKNYLIDKIESGQQINDSEKVFPDASEYLFLDSEQLEEFHTELIKIEEK